MSFNPQKPWYKQKAVWGGIIALLAAVGGVFGYAIAPELQGELAEHAVAIATAVGGVLAIIGGLGSKDGGK